MNAHQIHIFISHSWKYSNHYETLADWIFNQRWTNETDCLDFSDYSVPKDDPIHDADNDQQLKNAIYGKIECSHVIVIPSGMYASHSKWIKKEIEGAKIYKKPILAVNPWGQEKKSGVVTENSDRAVGWNKKSIVQNVWELYRYGP